MLAEGSEARTQSRNGRQRFGSLRHGTCVCAGARKKWRRRDREHTVSGELGRLSAQRHLRRVEARGARAYRRCAFQLKAQGTQVVGVFSGYIDTDMAVSVTHLPKFSPLQVAERTLVGVQLGQDSVFADERTEDTWKAVRTDPEGFHARIQQMWDASHG